MPDRYLTLLLRVLLCALALSAFTAQAQLAPQYRVELVVFSNSVAGTAEQWEATPDLAYPRNTQFLLSSESVAAAPAPLPAPASAPPSAPNQELATAMPTPAAAPPAAYVTLPASQRELGASAAALQRSGRYHILFHEAWTQPITGQGGAASVVLDHSGDGGQWPALQGTVKIYQAGAFFVDTNLWLNTSGEYLPGAWRMPAPPRAPASRAMESPAEAEPLLPEVPEAGVTQPSAMPSVAELPSVQLAAADYPYRHAVLLKQSRKMRAGQLNYIDHPLLGVLVKITPLTDAEPAAPGSI